MNLSEEFRKFAAECERMAKLTHDPKTRMHGDACRRDGSKTRSQLKKDIPRLSRRTAIESALTLGLTEPRARVSSPLPVTTPPPLN
jgi:hypothetical protein